jgi:hypothetical protein
VIHEPRHDQTFRHLMALSDDRGLFEHADGVTPRREHGYCTDDNARLLGVTTMHPDDGDARHLNRLALHFVRAAFAADGRCRNRMDAAGRWTDLPSTEDCWGRALSGLGRAAGHHGNPAVRRWALRSFDVGVRQRSPWPRAMAFAAIGAADVVSAQPAHAAARALMHDAITTIGTLPSGDWRWPEPRLRYANATLAEALIVSGAAIGDDAATRQGLEMLSWLLDLETASGHLSVVGAEGRGPGQTGPQFDQQPIEVAALADACWQARTVTGSDEWTRGILAAAAWFDGANDVGLVMHDTVSHGGFDGLHRERVNLNEGAESTLAHVSTMYRVSQLERVS